MPTRHPWPVIMRARSRNAIQESAPVTSHQPTPVDQEDQPNKLTVLKRTPGTNVMRSTIPSRNHACNRTPYVIQLELRLHPTHRASYLALQA
jgi:hypothetical protein